MDKKKKENKDQKPDGKLETVEGLNKQIEEYKNKYLRALADYQNLENRIIQERKSAIGNANNNLVLKLLPFLDNLEKAEIFVKDEGLKITRSQLEKVLTELGLVELEVLNREYDPYTAEVIDLVEGEKDNVVTEVLRKGYRIGEKILRAAQVKVSKKSKSSQQVANK